MIKKQKGYLYFILVLFIAVVLFFITNIINSNLHDYSFFGTKSNNSEYIDAFISSEIISNDADIVSLNEIDRTADVFAWVTAIFGIFSIALYYYISRFFRIKH